MSVGAAIYSRKSTTQEKSSEEARSVARQIALAREFADRQGWIVSPQHIYIDDGISGGVFDPKQRPGLAALLRAAKSRPRAFDVLVVMNQSRLARRQRYAVDIVHDLTDAGVRIFHYQTGLERKMATASDRFMVSVDGFSDEAYRESVRVTTRETMRRKAERGEVAGGMVYGYRNVRESAHGVRREPDPVRAKVVRRIFTMAAEGKGIIRIAKTLTAEFVPTPSAVWRAPRRKGWAPSAVRAILHNEIYRGRIVYGRTRWQDKGETKVKVRVPESEWIRKDAPDLRIVGEDLWAAAHERIAGTRKAYLRSTGGQLWGRPETGTESRYLLSGFTTCSVCGASLIVRKRPDGKNPDREPRVYYACAYHHQRGAQVCVNGLAMLMADADTAVLDELRGDVLHPEALRLAVEQTIERYTAGPGALDEQQAALETEARRVQAEIGRLVEAIASGAALPSMAEGIREREARLTDLRARIEQLAGLALAPRLKPSALSAELALRLTEWRDLLGAEPIRARQIVRKVVVGRMVFEPNPASGLYQFTGQASYGRLFSGIVPVQDRWCPRGSLPGHDDPITRPFSGIVRAA